MSTTKPRELKLTPRFDGDNFSGYDMVDGSITMTDEGEVYHVIEHSAYVQLQAELEMAVSLHDKWRDKYYDKCTELNTAEAENEKLKLELEFTKHYLDPANTSFRTMMDGFRALSPEKKGKLIDLVSSLAALGEQ